MIYLDVETFNASKDISVGTYEYARTAEILIATYALDDGPVYLWDRAAGEPMPKDLSEMLEDQTLEITAHHAIFDRNVIAENLGLEIDRNRWRCTMAKALAHSLPGALGRIGRVLEIGIDKAKLADGKRLINRFCKPAPSNHKADRYTQRTHPAEWMRFCDYAKQDIVAMREVDKRLPDWNYRGEEVEMYLLDQTINDRGFQVDQELVRAGSRAAVKEKETLADRFVKLTEGRVEKPTQRDKFRQYLNETFSLALDNTRAQTFKDLIATESDTLPTKALELMQISILSNKSSTAKYGTLEPAVSPDGRFRGGLQYAGAARTRRWAGRVFQPHNLPSRGLPPQASVDQYIHALKDDVHDLLFDDLMLYGSAALRGVLVTPDGRKLVVSDLSNIEGRVNAWLAGETWKLEAFAAFDRGEGPDLYNVTAGSLLGRRPDEIDKTQRNVMGKVPELALGYQGGVGAFQTFSKSYGVKMADHWDTIQESLPEVYAEQARYNYEKWGKERAADLPVEEWLASETVKLAWRARHPKIEALWHACEEAAARAMASPGQCYRAGKHLLFKLVKRAGHCYLLVRMPSNRFLVYFDPSYDKDGSLTYMGIHAESKAWVRLQTYGGKIVENACQSFSRDILAANMQAVENSGYEILLTVHDEIVTETPDTPDYNATHLSKLMAKVPEWAQGLPLAAAGFEADRYRKD